MLERITESPWYTIQVNNSTNVANKATVLVFVQYIFLGGYVMCTFVANQHHSCRTIQVTESYIRKTKLVILCEFM